MTFLSFFPRARTLKLLVSLYDDSESPDVPSLTVEKALVRLGLR